MFEDVETPLEINERKKQKKIKKRKKGKSEDGDEEDEDYAPVKKKRASKGENLKGDGIISIDLEENEDNIEKKKYELKLN